MTLSVPSFPASAAGYRPVRQTIVKTWKTRQDGHLIQLRAVRRVEVLPAVVDGDEPGLVVSERYFSDQRPISKVEFTAIAGEFGEHVFHSAA